MPADRPKGRLASSPITRHAMAEAMAVPAKTLPKAIPEAESMPGFTASM